VSPFVSSMLCQWEKQLNHLYFTVVKNIWMIFTSVTGWVYVELLILEPRCYTEKITDEARNCTAQDCYIASGHSAAGGTHGEILHHH
jgi:hypothetical protein